MAKTRQVTFAARVTKGKKKGPVNAAKKPKAFASRAASGPQPGLVGGTNDVGVASDQAGEADPGTYGKKASKGSVKAKVMIQKAQKGKMATQPLPKKPTRRTQHHMLASSNRALTKRQQELAIQQAARDLVAMNRNDVRMAEQQR